MLSKKFDICELQNTYLTKKQLKYNIFTIKSIKKVCCMPEEIRFCKPVGKYDFLSPLSAHPIKMVVDGQEYIFSTVEHYYQAMKFYASDERFVIIIGLKDPDNARLLTKTPEYKINRRKGFDKKKFNIMKDALYAKFEQNPDAAELLKSTGDAMLIKS